MQAYQKLEDSPSYIKSPSNGGSTAGPMNVEMLPGGAEAHNQSESPQSQYERRAPVHLIVLSDGTWMSRDEIKTVDDEGIVKAKGNAFFTNVSLLSQALLPYSRQADAQGRHERQISLYQKGIGAGKGFVNFFRKIVQGATGHGIGASVVEAYNFVVDNYHPGDSISAIGYSRGAYTVRTLVALLNWAGVLTKEQDAKVSGRLWRMYQTRDPSQPETIMAASKFLYDSTGHWPSRSAERTEIGLIMAAAVLNKGTFSSQLVDWINDAPKRDAQGRAEPPMVRVVGVWDTVGSLGVPPLFLSPDLARFYSFFDPMLSPNVRYAFHAMALSERRVSFKVTSWYLPRAVWEDPRDTEKRQGQVLKQCWFKGSHSDVGGGKACRGLSDISLAWMVAQIQEAGGDDGPLLAINESIISSARDMKHEWAKQLEQPPPWYLLIRVFRAFRQVRHNPGKFAAWSDLTDNQNTCEMLHHSVTIGGQYSTQSQQFAELAKRSPDELDALWQQAQNANTLLETERRLRW